MKKEILCLGAMILSGALFAEMSVAPEGWNSVNCKQKIEKGVLEGTSLNADPLLMAKGIRAFAADDYTAASFTMRTEPKKGLFAQLFWGVLSDKNFKEQRSVRVPLIDDGKMHTYYAVLSSNAQWQGPIVSLRLDPVSQRANFALAKFELLRTFKITYWPAKSNCTLQYGEDGEILGTFPAGSKDPSVTTANGLKLAADKFNKIEFELALSAGCSPAGQIFWTTEKNSNFSESRSIRFNLPAADGQYHKVTLDLSKNPEWKGIITRLRFDMTNTPAANGTYQLKNVKFDAVVPAAK
ncbi:MAG: hypothetical protein PHS41_02340 [Victivallaceae bacterium]|nr:hypothetical protein [Victivallaceae bacterium]